MMARTVYRFHFDPVLREIIQYFEPIPIERFSKFLHDKFEEILSYNDQKKAEIRKAYHQYILEDWNTAGFGRPIFEKEIMDLLFERTETIHGKWWSKANVLRKHQLLHYFAIREARIHVKGMMIMVAHKVPHRNPPSELEITEKNLTLFWKNLFRNRFTDERLKYYARMFLEELRTSPNTSEFRRIFLTVAMLKAILLKNSQDPSAEDYIQCLMLYFSAIPDPFVSKDEMHELLTCICNGEMPEYHDGIMRLADDFAKLFQPENVMLYTPRCLKHLCRCAVRNYLPKTGTLFTDIDKLHIPPVLKNYLIISKRY